MTDAAIISTARTPIGRAYKGTLVDTDAFELAQHVVTAAVERSGIDPQRIDDIQMAETLYGGGVIGRYVAIDEGDYDALPMTLIDRVVHTVPGRMSDEF